MKNVNVYSTNSCGYCQKLKQYLGEKGITYQSFDVGADQEKAQEMVAKSGQMGVPVIDIEGEIIVGFDKGKIDAALGI